jgi:hypothetical protein
LSCAPPIFRCDENGLTEEEAARRLDVFGPNKLPETKEKYVPPPIHGGRVAYPPDPAADLPSPLAPPSAFLQFLSFMWNPLSWVMEGAALVAIALSNGGGRPPDWQDFVGIVLLLLVSRPSPHSPLSVVPRLTFASFVFSRSTRPLVSLRSATPETPSRP